MGRLDFHIEFHSERTNLNNSLKNKAETRLRELAADRNDLIGASIAVEELAQEETPHIYQARVVAYIRPENIVAVEKADALDAALKKRSRRWNVRYASAAKSSKPSGNKQKIKRTWLSY